MFCFFVFAHRFPSLWLVFVVLSVPGTLAYNCFHRLTLEGTTVVCVHIMCTRCLEEEVSGRTLGVLVPLGRKNREWLDAWYRYVFGVVSQACECFNRGRNLLCTLLEHAAKQAIGSKTPHTATAFCNDSRRGIAAIYTQLSLCKRGERAQPLTNRIMRGRKSKQNRRLFRCTIILPSFVFFGCFKPLNLLFTWQ